MSNLYEGRAADARQSADPRPHGTFRRRYRRLSEMEIAHHDAVKNCAEDLLAAINDAYAALPSGTDDPPELAGERGRSRALAKTKLEEAVMWAIRGLTA